MTAKPPRFWTCLPTGSRVCSESRGLKNRESRICPGSAAMASSVVENMASYTLKLALCTALRKEIGTSFKMTLRRNLPRSPTSPVPAGNLFVWALSHTSDVSWNSWTWTWPGTVYCRSGFFSHSLTKDGEISTSQSAGIPGPLLAYVARIVTGIDLLVWVSSVTTTFRSLANRGVSSFLLASSSASLVMMRHHVPALPAFSNSISVLGSTYL
mmetsp:Transcript_94796/g.164500  ORF Transcript_94796/g.164500 Transcript_94796/m.164500 type:complete len:212 (+) Transcript_94796:7358-7993(+)